jgi:hypothetical protein
MNSISEYKIVGGFSIEEVEQKVNTLINQGWQPYGNLVLRPFHREKYIIGSETYQEAWTQAMVKY